MYDVIKATCTCSLDPNHDFNIGFEKTGNISVLAYSRKLGNRRSSEGQGLQNFKPSKGTNLLTLIILAGYTEMNPGHYVGYAKNTVKLLTNLWHAMTAKSAFMRHMQIPAKKNFPI